MFDPSSRLRTRKRWLLAFLAMVALVGAAACGGAAETEDVPFDGANYDELSGSISVDGSSTVFPITSAMAEEFAYETAGDVRVNVALSGTGGGIEKFCRGETDISNASRPIAEDEVESCARNGIDDIVEIQVAIDALSIVRHPENDWAQCLTVDEVTRVFRQDGAGRWSDVRAEFPDQDIHAFYPGADSGTFDYFVEVLDEHKEGATHTTDGSSSEDDNTLVTGVSGDPYAIGYFGLAYFVESEGVEPVAVDNGDGCVEPSIENALNGTYEPFSRPLFIYTREEFLREQPELLGFLHFYLTVMLEDIVTEVGYAPMPEDLRQEQVEKLEPFIASPSAPEGTPAGDRTE